MIISTGKYKGFEIKSAIPSVTRPLTNRIKQSIFDQLRDKIQGAVVYDIFCGSGVFGIEALSNGAAYVVFVDRSSKNCYNIKRTMSELREVNYTVVKADYGSIPPEIVELHPPNFVLVDPPYSIADTEQRARAIFDRASGNFSKPPGTKCVLIYRLFAKVPFEIEGTRQIKIGQDKLYFINV